MKHRGSHGRSALFLILALLAAGLHAGAQQPAPRRAEISEELAALVRERWTAIELDAARAPSDEWAGTYKSFDGPTMSTYLAWTPAAGFMIWWNNCSRHGTALVNYGGADFSGGTLKLAPVLAEGTPSVYGVSTEFIPVRWGEQRYLIPAERMINFAYAVHSTSDAELESFLVKAEDYERERKGLPELPPAYRKYLRMKPLTARAAGFGPEPGRGYPRVMLDAGSAAGVVRGMKFYLSRPGNIYMKLEVLDVREHWSEARVLTASFDDGRDEEITPQVGWRFSSRAPEDDARYLP